MNQSVRHTRVVCPDSSTTISTVPSFISYILVLVIILWFFIQLLLILKSCVCVCVCVLQNLFTNINVISNCLWNEPPLASLSVPYLSCSFFKLASTRILNFLFTIDFYEAAKPSCSLCFSVSAVSVILILIKENSLNINK